MTRRLLYLLLALMLMNAAPAHAQWRNGRLAIDKVPENTLNFFYFHVRVEFPYCAYGVEEKDGTIRITNVTFPAIYYADEDFLQRGWCDTVGLLGYGHAHRPNWGCKLSETDEETFLNEKEPYIFLICRSEKRFYWWSRAKVEEIVRRKAQGGYP